MMHEQPHKHLNSRHPWFQESTIYVIPLNGSTFTGITWHHLVPLKIDFSCYNLS